MKIGQQRMFLNYLFLFEIIAVLLTTQTSEALKYCYNATLEGYFDTPCTGVATNALTRFRLNTTVIKSKNVCQSIDCVKDCVREPCCRSVNFKMKLTSENERNCEMLHHVVYDMSEEELEKNSSYDYIYLAEPPKACNTSCFPKANIKEKSCDALHKSGKTCTGVYTIDPDGQGAFQVRCDMTTTLGKGWTVFQRRFDGTVDFYRNWTDYKNGFGNLEGEFWLGLDKIHRLTTSGQNVLRVDLESFENETRYAHYGTFSVEDESQNYVLTVGQYTGNAGDSMAYHNGMKFTTKDRDNDYSYGACAQWYKGAWWYNSCHHSNLNGQYSRRPNTSNTDGVKWSSFKGHIYSLKTSEMKVQPGV